MLFSEELASQLDIRIESHYICYFDILGYKEYMEDNPTKHKTFLVNLEAVIAKVAGLIQNNNSGFDIKYRTYSDNFLLFVKRADISFDTEVLKVLSTIMRKIQLALLVDFELLIRGGITIGDFYADEHIVFGAGLVRAYELEATVAKVPRIVVDRKAFEGNMSRLILDNYLAEDYDNEVFVNWIYDQDVLTLIRGKCIALVRANCRYRYNISDKQKVLQRERIIEKYIWLLTKFNNQCEESRCEDLMIDYELSTNQRLMKTEINMDPKSYIKSRRLK